jgi:hypothetical protein
MQKAADRVCFAVGHVHRQAQHHAQALDKRRVHVHPPCNADGRVVTFYGA